MVQHGTGWATVMNPTSSPSMPQPGRSGSRPTPTTMTELYARPPATMMAAYEAGGVPIYAGRTAAAQPRRQHRR